MFTDYNTCIKSGVFYNFVLFCLYLQRTVSRPSVFRLYRRNRPVTRRLPTPLLRKERRRSEGTEVRKKPNDDVVRLETETTVPEEDTDRRGDVLRVFL